jgi:hypothetical protein
MSQLSMMCVLDSVHFLYQIELRFSLVGEASQTYVKYVVSYVARQLGCLVTLGNNAGRIQLLIVVLG